MSKGFKSRYHLYDAQNESQCVVIPSEYKVSLRCYSTYNKQFNGLYSVEELEELKRKRNWKSGV